MKLLLSRHKTSVQLNLGDVNKIFPNYCCVPVTLYRLVVNWEVLELLQLTTGECMQLGHIGSWTGIHSKHKVIWKAEYIYYVLDPKQGLNIQFSTCLCVQDTQYVKDVLVPIGCGITGALLIVIVAYLWRNYWCRPKRTQQTPMVGVKVSVASWELPKKAQHE